MLLLVALGRKKVSLEGRVHRSESRSKDRRRRRVQDGWPGSKAFLQISPTRSAWILQLRSGKTHLVLLQEDVGHRGKVGQVGLKALHQPAKRSISGRIRERSTGGAKSRTHGPYSTMLSGTSLTKSLAILLASSKGSVIEEHEAEGCDACRNSRDELDV